ncbi:unnamed protein product [Paramecium sonneborni]|uniref:Ubiquitin carboxyl-terminal hydrolase n=1 Tax=Paramecium sonneborni TaxID=65129 RepID=A0A8S1LU07_9CILI|nr:unnamed protein product [Paramecium sonneborni]
MQVNQKFIDNDLLNESRKNGYSDSAIYSAWNASQGNITLFYEYLYPTKNQSIIINSIHQQYNDDIQKAMVASLTMHQQYVPFGKYRDDRVPCGLLNVGNTCYFNSLMQTYYFIYDFVSPVLKCQFDNININNIVDKRVANTVELVRHLQNLFVLMVGSDRQFVDPKQVILSICDDFGKALPIGDQKDVSEFNHYFLSRVDEGITYLIKSQQKTNNAQSQQLDKLHQPGQSMIQLPTIYQQNQSFISQKSQLMRQSSIIQENSIFYKLFYGKFIPQILVKGQPNKDCQEEIFNIIQIDVNHKQLPEALDKYMNQSVEYRNDKDEYQQAIKQFWIQSPPQILTFQIQRVEFNKEFSNYFIYFLDSLAKINSPFLFEMELYLDRYLLSNQKLARDIQTQNQQMRDKLNKIDKELEQFNQFNDNIAIIQNLENTLKFLKLQTSTEKNNPFYVDSNDNKVAIKSITDYLNHFIKKRELLLKDKKDTELKISHSYNQLKKQKYVLQSILMHEGSPDAGHYFAYIYNFDNKKWYYFNDIHVHEEIEQNVLKFAYGDHINSKSAYLIQYIQEDKVKQGQKILRSFSNSENSDYLKDQYGLLLSQKQRDLLYQENTKLKQEYQQQLLNSQIETIIQTYYKYFDIANEKQKQHQLKTYLSIPINLSIQIKPPYLENYAMFLKIKNDDRMFRWAILDDAVKKIMPQFNGFFGQPEMNEAVKTQILDEVNKIGLNKQYFPSNHDRQTTIEEYKSNIKLQYMLTYILESYFNNKLIDTLKVLHKFMKQAKLTNQSSFFYTIAIQLKQQMQLGIICKILQNKIMNDQEIQILKLLIAFSMQEHFQYTEPKLWSKQLQNLIGTAIQIYTQNEKLSQEVLKPYILEKKDMDQCQILDICPQDFDQQIESMQKLYLEKQFENNLGDFLLENLILNYQKLLQIKSIKQLLDNIMNSLSILDKKEILKIMEENPQIK